MCYDRSMVDKAEKTEEEKNAYEKALDDYRCKETEGYGHLGEAFKIDPMLLSLLQEEPVQ